MSEKIKDKIAKCLRKSLDSGASKEEKDTCAMIAEKLMTKHNIDRNDVIVDDQGQPMVNRIDYGRYVSFYATKKRLTWAKHLSTIVVNFIGSVKAYHTTEDVTITGPEGRPCKENMFGTRTGKPLYFYGPDEDALMAAQLFTELQAVIVALTKEKYGVLAGPNGLSYAEGFVSGLKFSCDEAKRKLNKQEPGLILRSEAFLPAIRQEATNWLVVIHNVRLNKAPRAKARTKVNITAMNQGLKDGKNYSVEKPKPQTQKRIQ